MTTEVIAPLRYSAHLLVCAYVTGASSQEAFICGQDTSAHEVFS